MCYVKSIAALGLLIAFFPPPKKEWRDLEMIIKKKKKKVNKVILQPFFKEQELFLRYCWCFPSVPKREREAGRIFLAVIFKIFFVGICLF